MATLAPGRIYLLMDALSAALQRCLDVGSAAIELIDWGARVAFMYKVIDWIGHQLQPPEIRSGGSFASVAVTTGRARGTAYTPTVPTQRFGWVRYDT